MRDKEIITRLWAGDPEGLKDLMQQYGGYVSAIVWRIVSPALTVQDAEEVVSDVFLAAWEHRTKLREGKVKAWLGTVARNKTKNRLRSVHYILPLECDVLEATVDPSLEEQERNALVRYAVDSLSEPDREIFLRHYFYLEKVSQIAEHLGMSESAVKSRLSRGREKLKHVLERWDVL